jgi:hypothetical protein
MPFVRNCRPQSTATRRPQPAARTLFSLVVLGVVASSWAARAAAQRPATVRRDGTPFLAAPGGLRLGGLAVGAALATAGDSGADTRVTLDGWIIHTSVRATTRDGYDLAVTRPENLRAAPNGSLVARLVTGALLDTVERRGAWVHVRRDGWAATTALTLASAPAASPESVGAALAADSADTGSDAGLMMLRRQVQLYQAPNAPATGMLEAGSAVRVLQRAGPWVRVEAGGWVRASDVMRAGGQAESAVTAADLRDHPEEWKGKTLRWTIQFLALQTADELRPDFTPGQRYILARGPAPEYAFVYLIVPPEKLAEVSRLQPLDSVTVLARVVKGRSTFLANPILELLDIVP